MFKKFVKSKQGNVVGWILVIAAVLLIGTRFFSFMKLSSASQTDDVVSGVEYVLEDKPIQKKPGSGSNGSIALGDIQRQINDVMLSPKIEVTPESKEYFYSYNDSIKIKAKVVANNAYKPKEPIVCKWTGIEGYTGTSCEPPMDVKLKVGENIFKVLMCDDRKACAESERKIYLGYKDPMLIMHQEWDNYVVSGQSGEWKYDATTNTIHSTKNVNWSGYWNPKDNQLEDYEVSFKMMVSSPDTDDDMIGFTFRQTDSNNYYFFGVDNRTINGGAIGSGVYKVVNGKRTRLVNLLPLMWHRNEWMDVRIKVTGSNIKVWANGNLVADVNDSSHKKGGYGPFSYSQAYARYKDLTISFD